MTIDELFGRYYRASILTTEPLSDVMAATKQAMADDATLEPAARARLAELELVDEGRCFISKTFREFLGAALRAR